ncbi:hypothetical protein TorRG33x02_148720 [Trema orientale]|uniref:Uncharacterized protein n=1 Tax=Trema orientale TaxID=63057 RepID=A0A2P5EUV8_TREOI|nr:hypothetical protein TorRG33x02_148720 [Trema orientale]
MEWMAALLAPQNQTWNHNHHDSWDDSRRKPDTVKCALLTDKDREFYWVRLESRFDIPSQEEVSDLSTYYAIEEHVVANKGNHFTSLGDCLNEVTNDGSLECFRLSLHDNLDEFEIENKLDIFEFLAQEANANMIENGNVELNNEKLEETEDLKHAYVLQGQETSAEVAIPKDAKTYTRYATTFTGHPISD